MLRFILTRLVMAAVVLLGISLIVFVAMRMVPGGFATAMLGPQGRSNRNWSSSSTNAMG
ncbi:MAG: hypothetical protein R2848_01405 [Thermomicrobiales bacterium]